MNFIEIFLIALALSIDCFVVSICVTSLSKMKKIKYILIPLHFAIFHIIMIILGYKIGALFKNIIKGFDHWIAFLLLAGVGIRILIDSLDKKDKKTPSLTSEWKIIMYSIATSIDALIIGLTFSFASVALYPSSIIIGSTVLMVSIIGLLIGRKINGFKIKYLDLVSGLVLIVLGFKILIGHLFF